jgi:phospholipase C
MWQDLDCNVDYAAEWNPSGCKGDLFPWVEVTIGAGSNGKPQAKPFTDETTGEGSTAMGFYNMLNGDAPYFKELADSYAMSDNFHQSVMGGTGANHNYVGIRRRHLFQRQQGQPRRASSQPSGRRRIA